MKAYQHQMSLHFRQEQRTMASFDCRHLILQKNIEAYSLYIIYFIMFLLIVFHVLIDLSEFTGWPDNKSDRHSCMCCSALAHSSLVPPSSAESGYVCGGVKADQHHS